MLDVEFAQISDRGRVREHNEDALASSIPATPDEARTRGWLFVLADGVGGQDCGEVASRMAVDTVVEGFRKAKIGEPYSKLLPVLVQDANTAIYDAARTVTPGGVAMATTIVSCALRYSQAVISHVGDSRCYLVRRGTATQITRDHTVASEQMRMGVLSAKQAADVYTRYLLSRSVGSEMFVNVETGEHQVFGGDVLVLCSDGLHGSVNSADIARVVQHHSALADAASELVAIANDRDGGDNISVQLIRIRGVEPVGMYRGRPYKLR